MIKIPKSVRLKVEVLASENRDFNQSERRTITVHLKQMWRATPFNPKLAGYTGSDMEFRLIQFDSQGSEK